MLCTQKDLELEKISDLSWLPWVGSEFFSNTRRLLIVGESHYAQGETPEEFQEDLIRLKNPKFTRKLIEETQIHDFYKYRLLDNFWKAFFDKDPNKKELWKNIAYYNFIQKSMDYSHKDGLKGYSAPNNSDFKEGWMVFAEVVKILQPTDCIFLGLKASVGFGNLKIDPAVSDFGYSYAPKIGNMTPVGGHFTMNGQVIDVSFIQHCSSHFSPAAWKSFLQNRHLLTRDFLSR